MGGITTIIINKVKYIGIASLTIAILSVLILNLISSYSSSNTNSNAEPVTQANGPLVSGPATISLSITPLTTPTSSPCDTSNSNICMKIPDDGGIATGGHTIKVSSNSYAGYNVLLSASETNNDETSLVNTTNGSGGGSNSYSIPTTTGNLTTPSKLDDNTWGYVLTNPAGQETNAIWAGLQPSTNKTVIATTGSLSNQTDSYPVYYGVRVDNPSQLLAGDYQTQVVYTATVKLPSKPTITSVLPNQYELGSGGPNTITISATSGLASTYNVWIDLNNNGSYDTNEQCTNLNVASGTTLTCNIPTDESITTDTPYTIYVQTQASTPTPIANAFTYTKQTGSTTIDSGTVSVDIDDSMIPVVYTGTTSTSGGKWTSVSIADIKADPTKWFDYTGASTNGDGPHWANAVTVENPENYRESGIDIPQDQIKGYWVYIPRYAYKVMRYSVNDKYVSDSVASSNGGFEIVFETKDTPKKTPTACSNSNSNQYYQDCSNVSQDYGATTGTAWATHPAFTWQYTQDINGFDKTYELNGFWIGKFETTGSTSQPTVLPNQYHQYPGSIGDMYDVAKSMGVEDPNNVYGNTASTNQPSQNNNNLAISTSHMLKNSEWGAVAYLSASKYGAGVNNVQLNNSYGSGETGRGPSGGAYNTADGQKASTTNNIYGVYDMAGGAWEYVMGSCTNNASQSMTNNYLSIAVKPPYVDLYLNSIFTNNNYYTNNNKCTWATCGGHALYETKNVQSVSGLNQSWGDDYSGFVNSFSLWFGRGGYTYDGSDAGVFASSYDDGYAYDNYGFRVALLLLTN